MRIRKVSVNFEGKHFNLSCCLNLIEFILKIRPIFFQRNNLIHNNSNFTFFLKLIRIDLIKRKLFFFIRLKHFNPNLDQSSGDITSKRFYVSIFNRFLFQFSPILTLNSSEKIYFINTNLIIGLKRLIFSSNY